MEQAFQLRPHRYIVLQRLHIDDQIVQTRGLKVDESYKQWFCVLPALNVLVTLQLESMSNYQDHYEKNHYENMKCHYFAKKELIQYFVFLKIN